MDSDSDLNAKLPHSLGDGEPASDRSGWTVKSREEAVACRVGLNASEAGKLVADRLQIESESAANALGCRRGRLSTLEIAEQSN